MTLPASQRVLIEGAAGPIETVLDLPPAVRGIALLCHPHPLFGGTLHNKVVQTLAKAMRDLGYAALRPNFRGVGESAGHHDHGIGESEDMLRVIDYGRDRFGDLPVVLGGFSFGGYVQTRVARRLTQADRPPQRIVLIGLAAGFVTGGRTYAAEAVPPDTLLIHGEQDDTVPLANVFDWARPQELPVIVVPGADHFFHRRLHLIRDIVLNNWRP
ncbi:MAG: alpha/beta fold hydrolase [Rhodocyclaceae bacterium]